MPQETNIPAELDTMAALTALVAATQAQSPKEDLPPVTPLIPDKDYSGPSDAKGATVPTSDPLFTSPAPAAKEAAISVPSSIPQSGPLLAPAAPGVVPVDAASVPEAPAPAAIVNPQRLFFTGRTGTGKDYLAKLIGATVLDINAPLLNWAKEFFPDVKMPDLMPTLQTVKAWGNGVVDKSYPVTPTRWMFVRWARENKWENFGTPGFWMNLLVASANEVQGAVAITAVNTVAEYTLLKNSGFTHFHVMTSPATYMQRTKRQGANDSLSAALDSDAIKKVSAQRQGEKLPVIWNDSMNPPSPRIWSLEEWKQALSVPAPVESIAAFE